MKFISYDIASRQTLCLFALVKLVRSTGKEDDELEIVKVDKLDDGDI